MSQNLKVVAIRIPECLTREAKAAAALAGQPLQEWYQEAVQDRLRRKKEETAAVE